MVCFDDGRLLEKLDVCLRVVAPMDYKDHVAIIKLVDNAAQLHIVIAWSKFTVIFVLPIT